MTQGSRWVDQTWSQAARRYAGHAPRRARKTSNKKKTSESRPVPGPRCGWVTFPRPLADRKPLADLGTACRKTRNNNGYTWQLPKTPLYMEQVLIWHNLRWFNVVNGSIIPTAAEGYKVVILHIRHLLSRSCRCAFCPICSCKLRHPFNCKIDDNGWDRIPNSQ